MAKKVMTAGIYTGHDRAQSTPETITPVDSLEKNVLQSAMPSTLNTSRCKKTSSHGTGRSVSSKNGSQRNGFHGEVPHTIGD